jgi:outer membrane protein TolC
MMGESQILKAQGGFDPKVFSDYAEKTYNSTTNFQKLNAGVTIPTWYGIQLKSGYEAVSGPFFNPESKTPSGGLFYGGISVTLGQGLMMDQRRAELFKARIYEESTQFEKQMLLNELVYESGYAYWNWFLAHHSLLVLENSYELALTRLAAVKISSEGGDRPMIDTVEARIQVQARQSLLVNFQNELANSRVLVSNYLWDESLRPLNLLDESTPIELETIAIKLVDILSVEELDSLVEAHPYLQMNNLKVKSLQVEQKLLIFQKLQRLQQQIVAVVVLMVLEEHLLLLPHRQLVDL